MEEIINSVYLGDWLELAEKLKPESVHLILTDSPFGTELNDNKDFNDKLSYVEKNIDSWLREMYRVLETNHHIYLYVPTLKLGLWLRSFEKYFTLLNILDFPTFTKNDYKKYNYSYDIQRVLFGTKGEYSKARPLNEVNIQETSKSWMKDKRNLKKNPFTYHYSSYISFFALVSQNIRSNIKANAIIKKEHPTIKNKTLIKYLILLSSNKHEIVLDCFTGSGNIPLSALELERNFIASEILHEWHIKAEKKTKDFNFKRKSTIDNYY
jgi:DNA modification methylase